MIELDLTSTVGRAVPVKRMRRQNRQSFCQQLQTFHASPHVQVSGNDVRITGMFDLSNCVPDVDRYRVMINNGLCSVLPHTRGIIAPSRNCFRDHPATNGDVDGTILLLLESPHKKEYWNHNVQCPIAPAQGSTGVKIKKYLECILNASCNAHVRQNIRNNSRVIIANPVQLQTSLWAVHKGHFYNYDWRVLRNAIWKTLWDEPQIRHEFCCRVRTYNPQVVLNCCTSLLRECITSFLMHCCFTNQMHLYKSCHPSAVAWNCNFEFSDL